MNPTSSPRFHDLLSTRQRSALDSGDDAAMKVADDAALAEAILASLAEMENVKEQYNEASLTDATSPAPNPPPNSTASNGSTMDEMLQKQRENTDLLRSWLDANGFDIVKNGGGGHNDCLLISLLQHATGDYRSEHRAEVEQCRNTLMVLDEMIKRDSALPSMSEDIGKLVDWLNEDKQCNLRVAIVAPGLGGEPTYHFYGKGTRYAMIFDQSGHYDAVVPRRA